MTPDVCYLRLTPNPIKASWIVPMLGLNFAIALLAEEPADTTRIEKQIPNETAESAAANKIAETRLAKEIAMRVIDGIRSFHRGSLQENIDLMEAGIPAQKALDEYRKLSMRMKWKHPEEWQTQNDIIENYAFDLKNAKMERDAARIMIQVGSVNASTEKFAAAELKLRRIRLHPPEGKGELFNAAERRFKLANIYDKVEERNLITDAERQKRITKANLQYLKLPWKFQEIYDPIINKLEEELDLLQTEAQSAKRAELAGDSHRLPDEKRWPAMKVRFDQAAGQAVILPE